MELLSEYEYELPEDLVAQAPLEKRSDSRLLVLKKEEEGASHRRFSDVIDFLNPGDALVINTSKVMKARLFGSKLESGGKVEVLLSRVLPDGKWIALVRAKGKKEHLKVSFNGMVATIIGPAPEDDGAFVIEFEDNLSDIIEACGELPLPQYITRKQEDDDFERYQTVYANEKKEQSVAAPTAGLHFDLELLEAIKKKGIFIVPVVLHVGPGTFIPVRYDDISLHKMHGELAEMSESSAKQINEIKAKGGRIIAVGTTAVRTLESAADSEGLVSAGCRLTRLFIRPGYRFKVIDALITNFHLPKTTLLMLVSATVGRKRILNAYHDAIAQRYRFFSYGDASYLEVRDLKNE